MRVGLQGVASNRARGRRGLIEQERDGNVALASQTFGIDALRLLAVGASVNDVINQRVQIVVVAVQLVRNALQTFGLHQLKLVAYRRDDAAIARALEFD